MDLMLTFIVKMVKYNIIYKTMQTKNLISISIFLLMLFISALILPSSANAQYYGCTYHASESCAGNSVYWYDSCGNQQEQVQYCQYGCYNGYCLNYDSNNYNNYNYNNYNSCTYHAYKLCVGNSIYWYNSCGNQQDLYYSCGGQTCQYGQCVNYVQPTQYVQTYTNYVAHSRTACSGNSIYWFDSLGANSGLYKNCADKNSCTLDSCASSKCSNTLKCDGSTCATDSADYNTYCNKTTQVQPTVINPPVVTPTNPNQTITANNTASQLSISFFTKLNSTAGQWEKTTEIGSNSQIYFMVSATNPSATQIDNINISVNIPTEISSLGNLQVNGVSVSGDIVTGINIGSIAPQTTKLVTFEGKTQTVSATAVKQAVVTSTLSGATQTDSITINLNPVAVQNQTAAVVSKTPATSGFLGFWKRWYIWILIGLALALLFIIVFKRLSSNI